MNREILQQALDALKTCNSNDGDDPWYDHAKVYAARDALRAALAAPERKMAPVQGWPQGIPWSLHLEAYAAYCKKWSPQPALIDLEGRNCRGGFGTDELDEFIPGWRERASEIAQLRSELAHAAPPAAPAPVPDGMETNADEVICPNCAHQFRAIPENVQSLLLASGHEPPFTASPAAPAAPVPAGWVMVPREPTPEMIAAYLAANTQYWAEVDALPRTPVTKWRQGTPSDATRESYRAMIAASPAAPVVREPLTIDQEKALSAEAKTGPFQHTTPVVGNDMQSGETLRLSSKRHAGSTPPAAPIPDGMVMVPREPTEEMIQAAAGAWGESESGLHNAFAAALRGGIAAAPAAPVVPDLKHCACEFDGDTCVTQCKLHAAHVDAIHEWAERAKAAEANMLAAPVPLTDSELAKIAVEDEFLLYCDQDSFNEIARAIEAAHGITGASK